MVPYNFTPLNDFVSTDAPICYGILKPGNHIENGVPVVKVKNIYSGQVHTDKLLKTSHEIHEQYKRAEISGGDLLLTIRGTTGRVGIVPDELGVANITQDTARIRVSTDDCSLYLFYALQSPDTQRQIKLNTVGQAVKGINIAEVKKLKILHPPSIDQQKIAKILSTWDKAISTTELLIVNSTQQKKALMQQLLTSKKRLLDNEGKRFEGEWEEVELKDIANIYQPQTISQKHLTNEGYLVYGANGIIGKYSDYNHENEQIAVTCRGSTCGVVNWTEPKSWITGNAMVINVDEFEQVSKRYLYYKLSFTNFSYLISGSGQPQITGNIKNHKAEIPSLKEQQKIATVLTNADQEIELLEQQLADLQQEKKALMQQLLTGKKRVVV